MDAKAPWHRSLDLHFHWENPELILSAADATDVCSCAIATSCLNGAKGTSISKQSKHHE
jgi:hypothetical protein